MEPLIRKYRSQPYAKIELSIYPLHQGHRQQRMTAEREEIVVAPDARHAQQLLPYTSQLFFDLALWRLVGLHSKRIALRRRQRSEERRVGKECRGRWSP